MWIGKWVDKDFEGFPSACDIPPTTTIEDMKTTVRVVATLTEKAAGTGTMSTQNQPTCHREFLWLPGRTCGVNTNMTGTIDLNCESR